MTKYTVTLIGIIFVSLSVCLGQTNPIDSNSQTTKRKYSIGVAAAIGNAASPTAWAGLQVSFTKKYIEANIGGGFANIQKGFVGIGVHTDLEKRFVPIATVEYALTLRNGLALNKNTPEERHYQVDYGHLVNYGVGLVWNPKFMTSPNYSVSGFFVKVGMRQLLAYTINPNDPNNSDLGDINRIYSDNFKTGLYVNLGVRVIAMHD